MPHSGLRPTVPQPVRSCQESGACTEPRRYGLSMTTEWGEPRHHAVGGLTEAGFDVGSGLLLVVSHQGRGVYDPRTGRRLARDSDETFNWFNERTLVVEGVGPLAGGT